MYFHIFLVLSFKMKICEAHKLFQINVYNRSIGRSCQLFSGMQIGSTECQSPNSPNQSDTLQFMRVSLSSHMTPTDFYLIQVTYSNRLSQAGQLLLSREYGIFGVGFQISTNQERESAVLSLLIG